MTFRNRVLRASFLPAALLAIATVTPATAQYWGPPPPPSYGDRIPPQHIDAMVRSMGYQPVAEPRPRGPLWVTHAVDRDGQHVRVLIDSFSGRVIDVLRRPGPPRSVSLTPPANVPLPPPDARVPQAYPPQARMPESDYEEDDGPDYDYRGETQRPQDWPPSRPNAQQPQQGPAVIPFEPRSNNNRMPAPNTNTAKKKEPKEKKKDATAALPSAKDQQKTPSPKARPADAPKADTPKADTPKPEKPDAPKAAETPTFAPDSKSKRGSDPQPTGAVPPVQPLETNKSQPSGSVPPVQPPF